MRRARIKAVANVPLRRKVAQDVPTSLPGSNCINLPEAKVETTDKIAVENGVVTTEVVVEAEIKSDKVNGQESSEGKLDESRTTALSKSNINDAEESDKLSPIQIPVPQSPENGFAALGSPPYRSDSTPLKSPGSPSKLLQNRSRFVRPVPRLDGGGGRIRRNSVQGSGASASESEDDGRRSISTVTPQRIRNDSCCSIQSNKEPTVNNGANNVVTESLKTVPKRRMVISESARKLAEARREFLHKHGKNTPDRNKLTMYDLIYYNPVTNPMKNLDNSAIPATRRDSVASVIDEPTHDDEEEENVDEPTAMPVPQVKVGPDGQLIIDEQSLVIEQTGAKKGREALENSEILVDEGRIGNGFYKRPKKGKDWPKGETLRFYIALNTIGTDFLLMQSLFPNRSRQEIKAKFKKEERTNRTLVEKALKYPQEFDIDALKEELAIFEEQEKSELENKKRTKGGGKSGKDRERSKTKKRKKCLFVTSSIEQGEETEEEELCVADEEVGDEGNEGTSEKNNNLSSEKSKRCIKRKKSSAIEEALDDLMQGAGIFSDSESDTEIYEVKPTRSGRCPKMRKLQAPRVNKFDEERTVFDEAFEDEMNNEKGMMEEEEEEEEEEESNVERDAELQGNEAPESLCKRENKEIYENDKNYENRSSSIDNPVEIAKANITDMSKVEPGSLVILSSKSLDEPGKTMLQVYMVSPSTDQTETNNGQKTIPVDLSPELLATVTSTISQSGARNVDEKKSVDTT